MNLPADEPQPPASQADLPPDIQDAIETVRHAQDAATTRPGDELDTLLTGLGLDAKTILGRHHNGTIAPTPELPESRDNVAIAALRPLDLSAIAPDFKLGRTLGEGGMGIVRLAQQVALARDVAIKSTKPGPASPQAALALLREAWVLGRLEHPNVVPIHTLGQDEAGAPAFVMKRVEGEAWCEFIAEPERLPLAARADPLRWHLGVLSQVCNAVAFAHSKGVLHRDLKPANVMIGPFGEVYVLDWGLAVSLNPDQDRIPLAKDVKDIAGTLHYMAPEMVAAKGEQLDERTDVYLLGALLHEVLTGRPRHTGVTPMEVLAAAWHSRTVDYGADVPVELAAIANRATSFNPAHRFPDALAMQQAIADFLEHRSSLEVADAAELRLTELRRLLDAADPDLEAVATTFSACRFGFQVALQSWPGNEAANQGLERALRLMIAFDLKTGNPGAARTLIASLPQPDPELLARVVALDIAQSEAGERAAELAKLQQELDLRIGSRTRSFVALLMGLIFGGVPAVYAVREWQGTYEPAHVNNFVLAGSFLVACLISGAWAFETMTKTLFNRRFALSLLAIAVANVSLAGAVWHLGLTPTMTPTVAMLLNGLAMALVAANLDTRLWSCTAVYMLAFAVILASPGAVSVVASLAYGISCLIIAWYWKPSAMRGTYDGDARNL